MCMNPQKTPNNQSNSGVRVGRGRKGEKEKERMAVSHCQTSNYTKVCSNQNSVIPKVQIGTWTNGIELRAQNSLHMCTVNFTAKELGI